MKRAIIFAALISFSAVAEAQDLYSQEIMVTASRIDYENDEFEDNGNNRPAVGLRRKADFLIQQVAIRGDTRDQSQRRKEIRAMLDQAVGLAENQNIELAFGEYLVTPLTSDNVDELDIRRDNRPDSERINFLIKASLANQNGAQAQQSIEAFIESVPENGRAQMDEWGEISLSVIGPDSFRHDITQAIADDAKKISAQLGEDYGVTVEGATKPVQWARSGLSDVFLYIPYKLTIAPKP